MTYNWKKTEKIKIITILFASTLLHDIVILKLKTKRLKQNDWNGVRCSYPNSIYQYFVSKMVLLNCREIQLERFLK